MPLIPTKPSATVSVVTCGAECIAGLVFTLKTLADVLNLLLNPTSLRRPELQKPAKYAPPMAAAGLLGPDLVKIADRPKIRQGHEN